jgi:putative tricarboxylic transport membrane protein
MLVSQGDLGILWSNGLVGTISTLAIVLLAWPLVSKAIAKVRPPKKNEFLVEQPVD